MDLKERGGRIDARAKPNPSAKSLKHRKGVLLFWVCRMEPQYPRSALVLAGVVAAAAAVASLVGLLMPDFYARDPPLIQPQEVGQDLVTLLVGVPMLVVGALLAARGSLRGAIVTAGGFFYMVYAYLSYAVGTRFNALFLVYVLVFSASAYGLAIALVALMRDMPRVIAWDRFPRRSLAITFFVIAAVFAGMWLSDIVPAMLSGNPPRAAVQFETPTSVVHVLDLGVVLPLLTVTGLLLLRRHPFAIPLAGVVLAKDVTLALAVLSMAAFAGARGQPVDIPVAGAMVFAFAGFAFLSWRYFRAIGPRHLTQEGSRDEPPRAKGRPRGA